MRKLALLLCILASSSQAMELEELRILKRFGIGFSAGGPLAALGIEADANLTERLSVGLGVGTGLQFNTFMVKARYFLLGEWVSPYVGLAVAKWWTDSFKDARVSPSVLRNKFLEPNQDLTRGFAVWMVAPSIGVQFMHVMGLSVFAEIHYLFKLFNFANGTYAGLGVHWYL